MTNETDHGVSEPTVWLWIGMVDRRRSLGLYCWDSSLHCWWYWPHGWLRQPIWLMIGRDRRRRWPQWDMIINLWWAATASTHAHIINLVQYNWPTISNSSFSALTLLVGRQKEHPACKNWVMSCWCGYQVQIVCIWSSWCHCIPKSHHILPHLNPDWFYLSGTT